MKRQLCLIIMLALFLTPLSGTPEQYQAGTWEYEVLVNGTPVGINTVKTDMKDGQYIHQSNMSMTIGQVSTITSQKVIETIEYAPVLFELSVVTVYGMNKTIMDTKAKFKGAAVTLTSGGITETFTISQPFVLDGNYFYSVLVKKKFADNAEATANLYHPSIEAKEPFKATVKVIGKETITIRGKQKSLIHLTFYMDTMKQADYYINDEGTAERIVQQLMNNTLELLLK